MAYMLVVTAATGPLPPNNAPGRKTGGAIRTGNYLTMPSMIVLKVSDGRMTAEVMASLGR